MTVNNAAIILVLIIVAGLGYFIGRLLQGATTRSKIIGVVIFIFTLYLFGVVAEWLTSGGLK